MAPSCYILFSFTLICLYLWLGELLVLFFSFHLKRNSLATIMQTVPNCPSPLNNIIYLVPEFRLFEKDYLSCHDVPINCILVRQTLSQEKTILSCYDVPINFTLVWPTLYDTLLYTTSSLILNIVFCCMWCGALCSYCGTKLKYVSMWGIFGVTLLCKLSLPILVLIRETTCFRAGW